jgi:hypothetical protein
MSRRIAWIVIAAALTSLLFATVATSGGVNLWGEPQWDMSPRSPQPIQIDESAPDIVQPPAPFAPGEPRSLDLPAWLDATLRVLFTIFGTVTIIAILIFAWRERPRLRWRRRKKGSGEFEVLPDVATAVVDEAEAQRAALLSGAPRNAIVQCWLRLEQDVASAGLVRREADTSAEFTERVLATYAVDSRAIHDLAALYREARFSQHPLGEVARTEALNALDRLHVALATAGSKASGAAL